MANGNTFADLFLKDALKSQQGPLDKVGEDASGDELLTALILAAAGGAATSGGSPFSTSPATTTTAAIPSELKDAVARFRVKLAIAALEQGLGEPQTLSDFIHHGPRDTSELGVDSSEVQEVASRKGTTTSRVRQKSRGEGTSAFEEAFSVALPLLVLLNQTGILGGGQTPTTIFDEGGFGQTKVPEGAFDAAQSGGGGFSLSNLIPGILGLFR